MLLIPNLAMRLENGEGEKKRCITAGRKEREREGKNRFPGKNGEEEESRKKPYILCC